MTKSLVIVIFWCAIVSIAVAAERNGNRTVNLFELGAKNDFNGETGTDIRPYLEKANKMNISVIEVTGPGWFLDSPYKPRSGITLRNGGGAVINRTASGYISGGSFTGSTKLPFKGKLEIGDRKFVVEPDIFKQLKIGDFLLIRKETPTHKLGHIGSFLGNGKNNSIEYWGPQEQLLKIIEKSKLDYTVMFDDRANFLYDFDGPSNAFLIPDVVEGFRCEGLTFNNVGTSVFSSESVVANISFMPGCVFTDNIFNLKGLSGGIFVNYSKEAVFKNNTFKQGMTLDIFIRLASPNTSIVNNFFTDHREGDGSVFLEVGNYNITVTGNRFDTSIPDRLMSAVQMDGKVTNCVVSNNVINGYGVGIRLELGSTMNTITGNAISHCGIAGIRLVECQKNVISNNVLRDNGRWAKVPQEILSQQQAQILGFDSFDTLITGNMIINTLVSKNYMDGGNGILLVNSKTCIIDNNIISGESLPITLKASLKNTITGNTIKDCCGKKGVILQSNSNLNIIRNNIIDADYMIYLDDTSKSQCITANSGLSTHICNVYISAPIMPVKLDVPNYFRIYRVGDEPERKDKINEYWEYQKMTGKWIPI